jgi:hypothetical protein
VKDIAVKSDGTVHRPKNESDNISRENVITAWTSAEQVRAFPVLPWHCAGQIAPPRDISVRFQLLTAERIKMTNFWGVPPCVVW